ncbi:MAG: recombinase family protein [Patescibacteria group bacterium]
MLVALYGRVSTQRQENERTIESQIMEIETFVKEKGHVIVKRYLDDGWSGASVVRPSLDELRLDATKGIWEAVVVYDPDRLARDYFLQELVTTELLGIGVEILYVTTPPVVSDSDKLLRDVKGVFAAYERSKIAERCRIGKLRKTREGHIVTTIAPYGYKKIPKKRTVEAHYEIDPLEAKVVKDIFRWVGEDKMTIRGVVRKLRDLGIKPRNSERGVWNHSTLQRLLKNETYIGTTYYNKSQAVVPVKPLKNEKYKRVLKSSRKSKPREEWVAIPVPVIIEKNLFYKVQEQLRINFELCVRNRRNEYLLVGMVYCNCGRRRTGEGPQHGKHLYYRCTDRIHCHPLPRSCHEHGMNARIVDKLVWQGIANYMSNPDLIVDKIRLWKATKSSRTNETTINVDMLKKELEKLSKEEQRYLKAYGSGMVTMGVFKSSIDDLKLRRHAIERQIDKADKEIKETNVLLPEESDVAKFCDLAQETLKELSFEAKRAILLKVVDKIIGNQKELKIQGYLPIERNQNVELWSECRDCRFAKRR